MYTYIHLHVFSLQGGDVVKKTQEKRTCDMFVKPCTKWAQQTVFLVGAETTDALKSC